MKAITSALSVVLNAVICLATGRCSIEGNTRRAKAPTPTALGNNQADRKGHPADANPLNMSDTFRRSLRGSKADYAVGFFGTVPGPGGFLPPTDFLAAALLFAVLLFAVLFTVRFLAAVFLLAVLFAVFLVAVFLFAVLFTVRFLAAGFLFAVLLFAAIPAPPSASRLDPTIKRRSTP
jgi:hypothetical protein